MKIAYAPIEEIVLHEATFFSLDDLVALQSFGVEPGGLARHLEWAEGVVFTYDTLAATPEVVKDHLQGKHHWVNLCFALMPIYQNIILVKETNIKVPIINVSNNRDLRAVAGWLKEHAGEL